MASSSPLTEATSGAIGTAISTVATYPLDLVNTRLKVQRQIRHQQQEEDEEQQAEYYSSPLSALRHIISTEGVAALYAGVGPDVAKSVVDSFLFFLFYSSLQSRFRRKGDGRGAVRELALAAAAGACARFVTTPVANVVARKQTAALLPPPPPAEGEQDGNRDESVLGMIREMWRERGVRALWAGYEASLVLSLNPGITFFANRVLEKGVTGRRSRRADASGDGSDAEEPKIGPAVVFLLAAVSKVVATAATYPFQTAKARLQVSGPERPQQDTPDSESGISPTHVTEENEGAMKAAVETGKAVVAEVKDLAHDNIFSTVRRIAQNEGTGALYDGLSGELLKAFFSHGITMMAKGIAQKFVVQLYLFIVAALRRLPRGREVLMERSRNLLPDKPKVPLRAPLALHDSPKESLRASLDSYDVSKELPRALPAPHDGPRELPRALPAPYDNSKESLRVVRASYDGPKGLVRREHTFYDGPMEPPRALSSSYDGPKEPARRAPAPFDGPRESTRGAPTLYDGPNESVRGAPAPYDGPREPPRRAPALYEGPEELPRAGRAPYDTRKEPARGAPTVHDIPREAPREPTVRHEIPREAPREPPASYQRPKGSPRELPAWSTITLSETPRATWQPARRRGSSAESVVINMVNRNQRVVDR